MMSRSRLNAKGLTSKKEDNAMSKSAEKESTPGGLEKKIGNFFKKIKHLGGKNIGEEG